MIGKSSVTLMDDKKWPLEKINRRARKKNKINSLEQTEKKMNLMIHSCYLRDPCAERISLKEGDVVE